MKWEDFKRLMLDRGCLIKKGHKCVPMITDPTCKGCYESIAMKTAVRRHKKGVSK